MTTSEFPSQARASLDAARTLAQLHSAAQRLGLGDALDAPFTLPDDVKHGPLKRSMEQLLGRTQWLLRQLLEPGAPQSRLDNLARWERSQLVDLCRAQLVAGMSTARAPAPSLKVVPPVPPARTIPDGHQLRAWALEHHVEDILERPLRQFPLPNRFNHVQRTYGWLEVRALFEDGPNARALTSKLGRPHVLQLQQALWDLLETTARDQAADFEKRAQREAGTPLPEDATLAGVIQAVRAERDRLRLRHPGRAATKATPLCTVEEDPAALVFQLGEGDRMLVRVAHWAAGGVTARHHERPDQVHQCVAELMALDDALTVLWLEPRASVVDSLQRALAIPSWARTLRLLEETNQRFDAGLERQEELRLCWRVTIQDGGSAMLTPLLQKRTKKGAWTSGGSVRPRELSATLHSAMLPGERRAAQVLADAEYTRMAPPPLVHAQALELLVNNPRVMLDDAERTPLDVRVAELGLTVAPSENGTYTLLATLEDGTPVNPAHVPSVGVQPGEPSRFCVLKGTTLTVVRAAPRVRALLEVTRSRKPQFPQDALPELMAFAAGVGQHVTVSLPEELRGDALPDARHMVVRLTPLSQGALHVEMLCLPLLGHPAYVPGHGAMEVHAVKDGRRVHVRRNAALELERARALAASLALGSAGEVEFAWDVLGGDEALDLVAALADRAGPELTVEWPERALRVTRRATSRDLKVEVGQRKDWFGIQGILEVDGSRVELAVLLDALRRKQRYVEVSKDRFVALDQQLRSQLQPLAAGVSGSERALALGPGAALALEALAAQLGGLKVDDAYAQFTEKVRAAATWQPQLPRVATGVLRDYQADGVRWLARLAAWGAGACLADDMGLGKTLQALMLLAMRQEQGPALVVAPTSVCRNWMDEPRRFTPSLKPLLYREIPAEERADRLAQLRKGEVLVISYGMLVQDAELLAAQHFSTLVLDEAQAVKNAATRRAAACRNLKADFKVALTGTPIENHLGELWSLMRTVFPPLLGSQEEFRERFSGPIEREADSDRRGALALLIRPFLLRRTKAQVALELPARTEVSMVVQLSDEEQALYQQSRLAAAAHLSGLAPETDAKQRFEVLAALTRLRLCACHPRLYDPQSTLASSKVTRLVELLHELRAAGHKALVFSQFTSLLALVRTELEKEHISYSLLEGQTPPEKRDAMVAQFQGGQGVDVFLISLRAGGMGLNLTAATYVIHLDPWWNPAVEDQASDRAHRIGQTRPVTIIRLVAQGTVEEQILSLHKDKRALVASILDGAETAGRLSTADLISLIQGTLEPGTPSPPEDEPAPAVDVVSPVPVQEPPLPAPEPPSGGEAIPAWLGGSVEGLALRMVRFEQLLNEELDDGLLGSPVTVRAYKRVAGRFGDYVKAAVTRGVALPQDPGELVAHYIQGLRDGTIEAPKSEVTIARAALLRLMAYAFGEDG